MSQQDTDEWIQSVYNKREFNLISEEEFQSLSYMVLEEAARSAGAGSYYHQYHHNYAKIDRYGICHMLPNTEYSGMTFITRPKLNLSSANLRANRILTTLDTLDPYSTQFMVRSLLDTNASRHNSTWLERINISPLLDGRNPFIPILTNNLRSISGFPSQNVETYTSEGGYFGEDYTLAIGSEEFKKSFDLQLSFVDPQGGIINYLFHVWLLVQSLLCTGEIMAYMEDIVMRRLCYTVSIYRFLLDPTRRFITRAAKCTGCFPISRPGGSAFEKNSNELFVPGARDISVTFKCNHFMENDPAIYQAFNTLVKRYWPALGTAIDNGSKSQTTLQRVVNNTDIKVSANVPESNYMGIPYVILGEAATQTGNPPELVYFYTDADDTQNNYTEELKAFTNNIKERRETLYNQANANKEVTWL